MTTSNLIELALLIVSSLIVARITKTSDRKVESLDGLGNVVQKKEEKGITVAHF